MQSRTGKNTHRRNRRRRYHPNSLPKRLDWSSFPVEIILNILELMPDLSSLYSTIQTCRTIYQVSEKFQRSIIVSIFCQQFNNDRYSVQRVFSELVFAVRQDFIARENAQALFEIGWKKLSQRWIESLLIPIGVSLAWTYCLDDRELDAVLLLRNILEADGPFGPPQQILHAYRRTIVFPRQRAVLFPILELLAKISGQPRQILGDVEREYQRLPCVEIDQDLRLQPVATSTLHDGILFLDKTAIVKTDQIPFFLKHYMGQIGYPFRMHSFLFRRSAGPDLESESEDESMPVLESEDEAMPGIDQ